MTENSVNKQLEEEDTIKDEDDKDPKTLLSLLQSWDVETYLEQQEEAAAGEAITTQANERDCGSQVAEKQKQLRIKAYHTRDTIPINKYV